MIACLANASCSLQEMLWTSIDAKRATFAEIFVYQDFPHVLVFNLFTLVVEFSRFARLDKSFERQFDFERLSESSTILALAQTNSKINIRSRPLAPKIGTAMSFAL